MESDFISKNKFRIKKLTSLTASDDGARWCSCHSFFLKCGRMIFTLLSYILWFLWLSYIKCVSCWSRRPTRTAFRSGETTIFIFCAQMRTRRALLRLTLARQTEVLFTPVEEGALLSLVDLIVLALAYIREY